MGAARVIGPGGFERGGHSSLGGASESLLKNLRGNVSHLEASILSGVYCVLFDGRRDGLAGRLAGKTCREDLQGRLAGKTCGKDLRERMKPETWRFRVL